jgi:hypothetical protein
LAAAGQWEEEGDVSITSRSNDMGSMLSSSKGGTGNSIHHIFLMVR